MCNIKAAFFDFDWTLFDHKTHSFVDSAVFALNELKNKGVKIFINSARSYFSLKSLKTFDLIGFDGYVVSNGGACFLKDECLYAHYLNENVISKIIEICNENEISFLVSTLKNSYIKTYENDENTKNFYSVFYEGYPEFYDNYKNEKIIAIQVFCTKEKDYLFESLESINMNRFFESCVEFTTKEFIKSEGINSIIKRFSFSKDELCAFGDELNDIDMFKAVKYSVCMGNGKDEAKKHAYHVTTNIEDDGILNGLKFLNLI